MGKKHNDKAFQDRLKREASLRTAIEGEYKKIFQGGLRQGVYAVCKTVDDMCKKENSTPDEKINAILSFVTPFLQHHQATIEEEVQTNEG